MIRYRRVQSCAGDCGRPFVEFAFFGGRMAGTEVLHAGGTPGSSSPYASFHMVTGYRLEWLTDVLSP